MIIIPIALYLKFYTSLVKVKFFFIFPSIFNLNRNLPFFGAIKYMPMADAIAIFLVNPFIMTFLSYFILGERIGWRRVLACIIGFSASLMILKPSLALFGVVALFPLGTAVTYSFYMIITKYMTKMFTQFLYKHLQVLVLLL